MTNKIIKLTFLLGLFVISLLSCNKKDNTPTPVSQNKQFGIFKVLADSSTIEMEGTIGSSSLDDFKRLESSFPNIKQINIKNCDGSSDDEVNLKLSLKVHQKGINIHLMDDAEIASGGVDFFIAGIKRTRGKSTRIGVHSWGGNGVTATDFPVGHANHLSYINYYKLVGFTQKQAEGFYYFTINAAPASRIHWMTEAEITQYNLITAVKESNKIKIDPEIEDALDKQNPLGFKYRLEKDKVTFVKVFNSYTKEAIERNEFKKEHADRMAQKFAKLIPYEIRKEVPLLYLTGARPNEESFSGFVQSIHKDKNNHWLVALGISSYIYNNDPENWFKHTVLHEYAHIKSANTEQAHSNKNGCANGELDSGNECFKKDSYALAFYNTFWDKIIAEWRNDGQAYYNAHKKDFVTGYAASNYAEDFAESFTFFVMEASKRSGNTIADKKVNFFYQYPYWVSIRKSIRKNFNIQVKNRAPIKSFNGN